jgi:diacylglycerol kinase (ATP)
MEPSFFSSNPTTVLSLYSPQSLCKTSTLDRWAITLGPLLNSSVNTDGNIKDKNKIGKALTQLGNNARSLFEKSNISKLRRQSILKLKTMNNYFGIGIDGAVSIAFDDMRHKLPGLFFHKLMNKLWYALIGIRTFLFGRNKDLSKTTKIVCDGKNVVIPSGVKGILVVNINSYAGGTNLWTMPKPWDQQKMNDGIVEVVAFYGLPHLGQIKAGLSKAIPIAQGKNIEISSYSRVPMQLDGEPFLQNPCKINICVSHQVKILQPGINNF